MFYQRSTTVKQIMQRNIVLAICLSILIVLAGLPPRIVAETFQQTANEMVDVAFGNAGTVVTPVGVGNDVAQAVVIQPDGKIVAAGFGYSGLNNDFAVARYNSDGTLDQSFGGGSVLVPVGQSEDEAFGIALQPDGRIVLVGQTYDGIRTSVAVVRLNADGSPDTTFDGDGRAVFSPTVSNALARSVAIQADGRIVLTGVAYNGTNFDIIVIRIEQNGSLDTTFDGNSGSDNGIVTTSVSNGNDQAYGIAVRPDGRIVVAGYFAGAVSNDTVVMRYLADGRLDSGFGQDGIARHTFSQETDEALALTLAPDGRIVIAGCIRNGSPNDFLIARLTANGDRDQSFGANGLTIVPFSNAPDISLGVALQPDGKIIAAGFGNNGTNNDFGVARVNSNGTLDATFGGDGTVLTAIGSSVDSANAVAVAPDGGIVAVGRTVNTTADFGVVRYRSGIATISGRVLSPAGIALRNVIVNLVDTSGVTRSAITSSFGSYQFSNVSMGPGYTLTARSKRYRFAPVLLDLSTNLSNIDIVGLE